jgi:mRNA interferase MazF
VAISRFEVYLKGKDGQVVLDPIRTVDRSRLITKLGRIGAGPAAVVRDVLWELFKP